MSTRYDTVAFLSDYGTADEFVGVVKSVIRDIARHVTVIDLTHEIPPYDVRAGSLALARCIQYVPSGVVLAIVDPGVGTPRRAVAVELLGGEGVVIGPDNGLLPSAVALAGGPERTVVLSNERFHLPAPGATFAGRDVFAPAAAHLCNGVALEELGELVEPGSLLPGMVPVARPEGEGVAAEILWVDRFGNAQLNVSMEDIAGWGDRVRLRLGETARAATVAGAFRELGPGTIGLVVDSYGLLAISLEKRSAADELHIGAGDVVVLEPFADDAPAASPPPAPIRFRHRD